MNRPHTSSATSYYYPDEHNPNHNQRRRQHSRGLRQVEADLEHTLSNERRRTLTEWTNLLGNGSENFSTNSIQAVGSSNVYSRQTLVGHRHEPASPSSSTQYTNRGSLLDSSSSINNNSTKVPKKKQPNEWSYKSDPICINNSQLLRQEKQREKKRLELIRSYTSAGRSGDKDEPESKDLPGVFVTDAEIADVKRCFYAADVTKDGYLSCEEFKNFMEYRRRPITHVEAKKLLRQTDPMYKSFIDLDQILFLVYNCGLTTEQEIRLTAVEHQNLIKRLAKSAEVKEKEIRKRSQDHNQRYKQSHHYSLLSNQHLQPQDGARGHGYNNHQSHNYRQIQGQRSPSSITHDSVSPSLSSIHYPTQSATVIYDNIELDGALNYFEDMANEVVEKQTEEKLYHEYRLGLREEKKYIKEQQRQRQQKGAGTRNSSDQLLDKKELEQKLKNYYPPPPGWKNMILPSQDPTSHAPISYEKVKGEWQEIMIKSEERKLKEREKGLLGKELCRSPETNSIDNIQFPPPPPFSKCKVKGKEKQVQPMASKSFATELNAVLQVYKEKSEAFAVTNGVKDSTKEADDGGKGGSSTKSKSTAKPAKQAEDSHGKSSTKVKKSGESKDNDKDGGSSSKSKSTKAPETKDNDNGGGSSSKSKSTKAPETKEAENITDNGSPSKSNKASSKPNSSESTSILYKNKDTSAGISKSRQSNQAI